MHLATKKNIKTYLSIAIAAAAICVVIIENPKGVYRLINALFGGGITVFCIGLLKLARRWGVFDLFIYSIRKVDQTIRKKSEVTTADKRLTTYSKYLADKRVSLDYVVPLLIGLSFLLPSAILTLLFA